MSHEKGQPPGESETRPALQTEVRATSAYFTNLLRGDSRKEWKRESLRGNSFRDAEIAGRRRDYGKYR